jgi:peptidyl-dipeptidase A
MLRHSLRLAAAIAAVLALSSCDRPAPEQAAAPGESADQYVERLNREMTDLGHELATAGWAYATYINQDTEFLNAKANERYLAYTGDAVEHAKQYEKEQLAPSTQRALLLLKLGVAAPAPKDPTKRAELAGITSKMEGMYGAAKYCPKGPESCKDQTQLSDIMATSRNYAELTEAWTGWHSTARPLRKDYARFVDLANEGAREIGFSDLGAMWRSNYDMSPDEFTKEAARLWGQVKPLYTSLHCYVRGKLQKSGRSSGRRFIRSSSPIPACRTWMSRAR